MSDTESQPNKFVTFMRGGRVKRPNLVLSFIQGAIVSIVLSLLMFKNEGPISMAVWAVVIGLAWVGTDVWLWESVKRSDKEKGE